MSPSQQPSIALIGLTPNEQQACKSSLQSSMPSCRFMDGEELSQRQSVGLNDATQRLLIVSRFSTSDSALSWIKEHSPECWPSFAAYAIIPNLDLSCASSLATAGFSGFSSEFETKAIETWALNLPPVKSASLEESQGNDGIQLYQRLIESMPDVIVRMDRQGNYLDVFASPHTDIPVDPEQVVGRSSSEVLPAPLHEECHRASEQAFETGQVSVNEMEMPVEGGTKWIECRSVAISEDELMVVVRDATDSVNRQVALDHNERLLRLAQQFTDTGIWEWEGSTNKVRFSSKLAQIYGLGESVWEGTYDELLEKYIHPGDLTTMIETSRRSIESGTSQSLEYRIVRPDGQERVLISFGHFLPSSDDGQFNMIGISHDITELKQIQKALRQRELDLAEVTRISSIGQVAAQVAHELNQPLFAVTNFAEAISLSLFREDRPLDKKQLNEWLENIASLSRDAGSKIRRMTRLVQRGEERWSEVELTQLLRDAASMIATEYEPLHLQIEFDMPESPVPVTADRVSVHQMVYQLLRNAVEAVESLTDRHGKITISCRANETGAIIGIEDNGEGFPKEQFDELCQPFYSSHDGSLGVGLAICKTIVQTHQGRFWSEPSDPGAKLFVQLPSANVIEDWRRVHPTTLSADS